MPLGRDEHSSKAIVTASFTSVLAVTFVVESAGLLLTDLLVCSCGKITSHGRASLIVDTRERTGLGRLRRNTAW